MSKPMLKTEQLNEKMQKFLKANSSDELIGYPWMLELAETEDCVPVALYGELHREAWSALKAANENFDVPEECCVPGLDNGAGWKLTTDVHAVKGNYAVIFRARTLKKEGILDADCLPVDANGQKSWAVLLDDVYRQKKHYEFTVDEKNLSPLVGKGFCTICLPLKEAENWEINWRETMSKVCFSEYCNQLHALAATEEEKYFAGGKAAKGMMLRSVIFDLLDEALKTTLEKMRKPQTN